MAFPIIPKRRSGASGNPTTLNLGELAVNTADGELYLGGDGGVMLLNGPVAAGTTVTEHTGDGTTVAFTFTGYNGTADGGYIVSVGGIDQPPSKYAITSTAGGTITFVEAPVSGELISIRALVAGSGGGGSGDATSLQGRDIATTAPTDGQVLAWNATTSKWEPTSINGSVTFNTAGTHTWVVPAWVRYAYVSAISAAGTDGTATNGQPGQTGSNAYFDTEGNPVVATTGANGADGTASAGSDGKGIAIAAITWSLPGGTGGAAGVAGYGGGGSGGGGAVNSDGSVYLSPAAGSTGNGPNAGNGGNTGTPGSGGSAGGVDATAGGNGSSIDPFGGAGGIGATNGGNGGDGGAGGYIGNGGGGGGGGANHSGGGGGAGGTALLYFGNPLQGSAGTPGQGGTAIPGGSGTPGASFADPVDFSTVAGTTISIVISEGNGDASITITY